MNPNPCAKCKVGILNPGTHSVLPGGALDIQVEIQFCPLHAAAEEMLKFLKGLYEIPTLTAGEVLDLDRIIKKAEGK